MTHRELEWHAQEKALRRERLGNEGEPEADAARDRQYRLIARLLADPPLDPIPPDFARLTAEAALARQRSPVRRLSWETMLEPALWTMLVLAGLASLAAGRMETGHERCPGCFNCQGGLCVGSCNRRLHCPHICHRVFDAKQSLRNTLIRGLKPSGSRGSDAREPALLARQMQNHSTRSSEIGLAWLRDRLKRPAQAA